MKTENEARVMRSSGLARRSRFWRWLGLVCMVAGLLAAMAPSQAQPAGVGGKKALSVYHANAYIGAEIEQVLALDPNSPTFTLDLLNTVTAIYYQVVASQPPLRIAALAQEIASKQPDIASLVEMYTLQNAAFTPTGPGQFTDVFNFLETLTNTLAQLGAHYTVAVVSTEADVSMPFFDMQALGLAYARLVDHEVILVRSDLPPGYLKVTNPQSGHFSHIIQVPELGINVYRGWCSVDVFTRGERFRYLSAHLETEDVPDLQFAQAQELLAGPANVAMPVMLTGDFNTDPLHRDGTVTYNLFGAAGFDDAWLDLNQSNPAGGLTWGHDALLADATRPFVTRIDLVFYRGAAFVPLSFEILDPHLSATTPPLWPSDHGAVTAAFYLGNIKAMGRSR